LIGGTVKKHLVLRTHLTLLILSLFLLSLATCGTIKIEAGLKHAPVATPPSRWLDEEE
jgi:hypothetical protein